MKNKVIKNASWIIGGKVIQALLGLVVNTITTRYLGPSNYGLISYASSIVAFVVPIMQLGLSNILVQEYISYPEEEGKITGTSIVLSLCSSIACIFGIVGFAYFANAGDTLTITVCALYSVILVFQAFDLVQYWFQAKYLSKYSSIASVIAYTAVSLYKILLLVSGKDVRWFAVSNALDYLIIAIALFIIYKKLNGKKIGFSFSIAKRMFSSSKYYIVSSLMVTLFAQTDKIMLTLMINNEATGYYSAAITCANLSSFVFSAIIDSARPAILGNKKCGNEAAFKENMSRLYCIILYLALLQSVFMTLLAKPIIYILYGAAYDSSVIVLQVIVWYCTFSYFGGIRNVWILAEGKQKYLWIINLSGAVLNIVLNAILIPICSAVGAAIASLVTQFFTNFVLGFIMKPIRENNALLLKGMDIRLLTRYVKFKKEDK